LERIDEGKSDRYRRRDAERVPSIDIEPMVDPKRECEDRRGEGCTDRQIDNKRGSHYFSLVPSIRHRRESSSRSKQPELEEERDKAQERVGECVTTELRRTQIPRQDRRGNDG
jgi:hypothetical protein